MIYSLSQALRITGCNSKIYFVFQQKKVDICALKVYNKGMKKGRKTQKPEGVNKNERNGN